jgi:hypothetical protein
MSQLPLRGIDYLVERGLVGDVYAGYRAYRLGLIPSFCFVRIGRFIRVNPARLEEWIASGGITGAPPAPAEQPRVAAVV